jgi:hypothetical protein
MILNKKVENQPLDSVDLLSSNAPWLMPPNLLFYTV